ncbi:MAG: FGGY-family carbohydrate kinase [Rhodobacteraceae bacterium]|nr:FGGY-family carbohydrate kinase [Paracoccaceae bacterium]
MTLALGIDIGTSGVRTAVLEEDGTLLSSARAAHVARGADQIDARHWWEAVSSCITSQVSAVEALGRSGADISRIAIDGTSGSMVLTDAALAPVGPALMYNSKGFHDEAAKISAVCPSRDHIALGSNSGLARALRLRGEAQATPAHLLHQADYIAAKLLGRGGQSDHNSALKTGFDPEAEDWPTWILDLVGAELLPRVDPVGTNWGAIDAGVAAALGLSPRAEVCAGTTDSIAAFLAAAPLSCGAAVTSIGSTLAIKVLSDKRIDLPAMGLYSHRVGAYWLVGGASNTGGAVLASFFSPDELASLSDAIDPSVASDLDYYPLLEDGERFPVNDPELAPRLTPRPVSDAAFLKGLFEGIASIEAQSYALIEAKGGPKLQAIYTAGGASSNETFTAIRERILGRPLQVAAQTEASIGTARLAQGLI